MQLSRVLLACILVATFGVSGIVSPSTTGAQGDRPLDIVVVIDNSGSMQYEKSGAADPQKLRYTAAKMLIDLVSDQDRIGVVQFSDTANSLMPTLTSMNDAGRAELKNKVDQAAAIDPGDQTSYLDAITKTLALFDASANRKAVIFLTDGLPTDRLLRPRPDQINEPELANTLIPFVSGAPVQGAESVPVFLMLLHNRKLDSPGLVPAVERAFKKTGAPPQRIATPQDLLRGFAFVLTQLQPHLYLDHLDGVPETQGGLRFEAQATEDQSISEVTFVLAPAAPQAGLGVNVTSTPTNASTATTDSQTNSYIVQTYGSTDLQPIDGTWQLSVNSMSVQGFAVIRSNIGFELVYPRMNLSQQSVAPTAQPLLVGVKIAGTAPAASTVLEARLRRGQCLSTAAEMQGDERRLRRSGLSPDSTLYWEQFQPPLVKEDATALVLDVELRQLNKPLRLARCFTIVNLAPISGELNILEPNASTALQEGTIPLAVQLPTDTMYQIEQVQAFIEPENGGTAVEVVTLDPGTLRGQTQPVVAAGPHVVRFIARLQDDQGNPYTLFAERTYNVSGAVQVVQSLIEVGPIAYPGQTLTGTIQLVAPLVSADTPVTFTPGGPEGPGALDVSALRLCSGPGGPTLVRNGPLILCTFELTPPPTLQPGTYQIPVRIAVPDQELVQDTVTISFHRDPSRIVLTTPHEPLLLGDQAAGALVYSTNLDFRAEVWNDDPQLNADLVVQNLRFITNAAEMTQADPTLVSMRLVNEGLPPYMYRLVVKPKQELFEKYGYGTYRASVSITSSYSGGDGSLLIEPATFTVEFRRSAPFVDITLPDDTALEEVWGPLGYIWKQTRALPVVVNTASYDSPLPLPSPRAPAITRVGASSAEEAPKQDAISVGWRDNVVANPGGSTMVEQVLKVELVKYLPGGVYEIKIPTPDAVRNTRLITVRLRVLGWNDLLLRMVPLFIGVGLVVVATKRIVETLRPRFRGRLVLLGTTLLLSGRKERVLEVGIILKDGRPMWVLQPPGSNPRMLVRCISRDEIELSGAGTRPLRLRLGQSLGNIKYTH